MKKARDTCRWIARCIEFPSIDSIQTWLSKSFFSISRIERDWNIASTGKKKSSSEMFQKRKTTIKADLKPSSLTCSIRLGMWLCFNRTYQSSSPPFPQGIVGLREAPCSACLSTSLRIAFIFRPKGRFHLWKSTSASLSSTLLLVIVVWVLASSLRAISQIRKDCCLKSSPLRIYGSFFRMPV